MSSRNFIYNSNPARVVFGVGTIAKLEDEAEALGINRALVLTTSAQQEQGREIVERLGGRAAGLCSNAQMHTPVTVTEDTMRVFAECGADGIVSCGGGSTIGLGKAIAYRNDAPQIVIPTSYAGSEMTPILGQTEGGVKKTLSSPKVLPETVLYDVNYTLSLPHSMTLASGMNAVAHAVEALYSESANPVLCMLAEEAVSSMVSALGKLSEAGQTIAGEELLEARTDALYGAWLCGTCLGLGGVALHHKLCHVLGGSFDLPHAETHTVVLPHALAYNAPAIAEPMDRLKRAMGTDDPAGRLYDIAKQGGAPVSLRELGMPAEGIASAVRSTLDNPYFNPRELEAEGLTQLLESAWHGNRPS
ncbi:Alcohol dehydrogenase, class IV [Parasphingorhabdus marina DSM 22363]|uniref:Alcohol dehydrogenase, class IV n=1 Tax=Parasphingorhabdus marina DSM 22363 TaxID=1123272 RepID=A0A1N6D9V6_9SPHN|nr:maleylacetate reductase [Parasphingorhabdus marina]SIN67568.1 Alcohol dehydrogenase, class IV [Parasphingorhabdus marina DSM 22363]